MTRTKKTKPTRQVKKRSKLGKNQQKILLLLMGGLAMGLSRSPKYQYRIMRGMIEGWREIDGKTSGINHVRERCDWKDTRPAHFKRAVDSLYKSKLVRRTKHKDGSFTLVLTDEGRKRALHYHLGSFEIKQQGRWDGKWRVVMYDVPEAMRDLRLDLYHTLRSLGFVELQHSVFAHPYECKDEIEFLIETYNARAYVRRLLVEEIDITEPLKKAFKEEVRKAQQRKNSRHITQRK